MFVGVKRNAIILVSIVLLGCSSLPLKNYSNWMGYSESGKASYYASKYQNRKTASGELFDHFSHTAAHRRLPFGTRVQVRNVNNNKSVLVKINDRGPFIKGRIIDLSRSAFSAIGDLNSGVIEVEIVVIE